MTIAWNGLRRLRVSAVSRTRRIAVMFSAVLLSAGCAKQEDTPPTASATAAVAPSAATAPVEKGAVSPPSSIPAPFHGTWASTEDACQLIQTEGLEPAVTITANEIRDVEYETYCKLHKVVSASATELVAEFDCPSADDPTPAPAQRTFALAAGRLVFQDRPVSYLRCSSEVPAPPVELAGSIEAPPTGEGRQTDDQHSDSADASDARAHRNAADVAPDQGSYAGGAVSERALRDQCRSAIPIANNWLLTVEENRSAHSVYRVDSPEFTFVWTKGNRFESLEALVAWDPLAPSGSSIPARESAGWTRDHTRSVPSARVSGYDPTGWMHFRGNVKFRAPGAAAGDIYTVVCRVKPEPVMGGPIIVVISNNRNWMIIPGKIGAQFDKPEWERPRD